MTEQIRTPLIAAGILMGAGFGGFIDGIMLHQILQWHNMISSQMLPNDLVSAKVNMTWDGYFHLAVLILTLTGLAMFWSASKRTNVLWSGKTFLGSLILGWGLFNLIEGLIDHQLLGIHHVYEYTDNKLPWDLAFLLIGGILLSFIGWLLINAGRKDNNLRHN